MSLESALTDHVEKLLSAEGGGGGGGASSRRDDRSLRSVRLAVLSRVARFLRIPLDPADLTGSSPDDRVVLSRRTLRMLDEAWHRITGRFSDHHVTPQERLVRQQVFLHAPYYVEKKTLSKFVSILSKKDVAHGFYATAATAGRGATKKSGNNNNNDDDDDDAPTRPLVVAAKTRDEEYAENGSAGVDTATTQQHHHNACRSEGRWEPLGEAVPHLKSNVLNRVLAVDGFRGLSPSSYKFYVSHLNDRSSVVEKRHLAAVRSLYYSRSGEPGGAVVVEGRYSGTFYASCVFLTLVRLFSRAVGVRTEDFVRSTVAKAVENASRFVEDNDEEGDFSSDEPFEKLTRAYLKKLNEKRNEEEEEEEEDDSVLECIAMEKLKGLARCVRSK